MDINALIHILQESAPQITESCCIVNGALMNLEEVQNMGYEEFSLRAKINMPLRLYKYFPNRQTELIDENSGKPVIDEHTGKSKTVNYSTQEYLSKNNKFVRFSS